MIFGIPKEVRKLEKRVGLTPAGVLALVRAEHMVYVEQDAGIGAGFSDEEYRQAGAQVVYSAEEAYRRADVVVKVARPTATEHQLFTPQQTICSLLYLSVASTDLYETLVQQEITTIAYEMIRDDNGAYAVLWSLSEIAGRLAPLVAGQLLTSTNGGRGTLLGGLPGVPPAAIVILGGGTLGTHAARAFLGLGAQVTLLDQDIQRLRYIDDYFQGRVTTRVINKYNLRHVTEFADVLIGAVLQPGKRAPVFITENMVKRMRPGSVIIDYAIDQGGCVETSRPTHLGDPTFIVHDTIHYCVPNITSLVARTTSYAITNAALPYLLYIGEQPSILTAIQQNSTLARGVNTYLGKLVHPDIATTLGYPLEPLTKELS